MAEEKMVCLVSGGRGFFARQLVYKLLECKKWTVRIMDLSPKTQVLEEELLSPLQEAFLYGDAEYVSADLRNRQRVFEVCKGVRVVFHTAAPDSSVNDFKLHYDVSVTGTRNIIDACLHFGVKKLVYTSSPSVVFDGVHAILNGDESLPYLDKYNDYYSETKAQAEFLVLKANGQGGLVTCAIRPSGIFGPGDKLLLPSLVNAAKSGKLKFIIGDGQNVFDWTYVENVAHAHICAEQALNPGAKGDDASGKAYFITNCEPRKFWDFVGQLVEQLGYTRPTIHLPFKLILAVSYLTEWACTKLALGVSRTQFSPARIFLMTSSRTFNCTRATQYLNYTPQVSLEEGIRRTVQAFWYLRSEKRNISFTSKVHSQLGGGIAADLLLWKDWRGTVWAFLSLYSVFYLFFRSGLTLTFVVARLILILLLVTYFYSFLREIILDHRLPEIPAALFRVSEGRVLNVAASACSLWNNTVQNLQLVVQGRDWYLLFKVLVILRVMSIFGKLTAEQLLKFCIFTTFSIPFIYEQNEQEIRVFINQVFSYFHHYKTIVLNMLFTKGKGSTHKN